ncbi:membrane protein [Streptomyces sp. NRRL F-4707]|nr:membrane protein [Streptomyces sp. NRRL F-4711]KOX39554.1 membrane protein [Streptomyces sp. NRRL F-4707]
MACVALGAVLLTAGAAVAYWRETRPPVTDDQVADVTDALDASTRTPSASSSPSPSPSVTASTSPSASPSASPSTIAIPATGPGTFVTAQADGTTVGTGSRVRRYKVLVEEGIDVRPGAAADEIAEVLADRRGWTRDGTNSFRLVSSGSYDFVVKIATPGTVDKICGAAGLLTRGEVNCSVGTDVVVNLKRWVLGSPEFDGPIHEYRALIVNHEVGHRIGHGHETCPGAGRPAPAMMQQIKGLKGCVANAWPYDESGTYLSGPSVP